LEGIDPDYIVEKLMHIPVNINLAQLFGIGGVMPVEVHKSFKKAKNDEEAFVGYAKWHNNIDGLELVNNPTHRYCTREVQEYDIAMVSGSIYGFPSVILIDGGSNISLETKKFLTKHARKYTILGTTSGRVYQALTDAVEKVYEIVQLEMKIGTLKINAKFGIVDNGDHIFDIIINLKTQADYILLWKLILNIYM